MYTRLLDNGFAIVLQRRAVLSLAWAIRMPRAAHRCKRTRRRELLAAEFAIVVFHDDLDHSGDVAPASGNYEYGQYTPTREGEASSFFWPFRALRVIFLCRELRRFVDPIFTAWDRHFSATLTPTRTRISSRYGQRHVVQRQNPEPRTLSPPRGNEADARR